MIYDFVFNIWNITQELALWLWIGCAVAGGMHAFLPGNFIHRHFGKSRFSDIFKATLLGVPLPLCSCGVIPAAIGLKKDGASDAAAVGFLVSTPQTGVDSIAVSAAFLGLPFALFKVASATATGVIAGVIVWLTGNKNGHMNPPPVEHSRHQEGLRKKIDIAWRFAINDLLAGFAMWVVGGILVSAAISTLVPPGQLADNPLATGLSGILLMLLIALPMYVCATGSVPVAAALVAAGMPTGAALVFLMAGPATNAASLGAIFKTFGGRVTAIYVSVIAVGSVLCALLFESFFGGLINQQEILHKKHAFIHQIAAVALLAFFLYLAVKRIHKRFFPAEEETEESCCCS